MYQEIITFAQAHRQDDPLKLLLQQKRYPDIDLRLVAQQLEGRRQAQTKWPTLALCNDYFYPPKLNREQSSSESAARHKAQLFHSLGGGTLADLTGGMGIDTYFIAQQATHATYCELNPALFPISQHNFKALGLEHVDCHLGDSIQYLAEQDCRYDMILVDPARRNTQGGKVVAFADCAPNIIAHMELLRSRCNYLMVKASPMIDIRQAQDQLGQVSAIHIVAVNGECKEVLFVVPSAQTDVEETRLTCVNLEAGDAPISFTPQLERDATPTFATAMGQYLYEPNAALMKGGCYNLLSQRYQIQMLARNTHLYTSDALVPDFPGRIFRIIAEVPLNAKKIAPFIPDGKAHVIARNYPMSAPELQKKLKLKEGGTQFVVAATLGSVPKGWIVERA